MNNSLKITTVAIVLLTASLACSEDTPVPTPLPTLPTNPDAPPRQFHLGFTPFPYDISQEAVNYSYQHIAADADIIAHHLDDGIPWSEALSGEPYPNGLQQEWEGRKANTPPGHKVYLAITPIRLMRDGLALYRGNEGDQPLPDPWDSYPFNHLDVKTAFLNHAINAIEFFDPDYLAIGIEVNLLLNSVSDQWDPYLELHQYVYSELKTRYPELPIFASVAGTPLLEGYSEEDDTPAHRQALQQLLPFSDYFAISIYPYMTKYMTDSIPADMFPQLFALSDKPIAIAETGYPAQTFTLKDYNLTFESDPEKQLVYFTMLLEQADQRDFIFIINFVLRDYDALWKKIGGEDLATIWRDTGFYDEGGEPRPVLDLWHQTLARPFEEAIK